MLLTHYFSAADNPFPLMAMQTLVERPGFTISHDSEHCWLYVTWQGQHGNQSSRACCAAILDQVRATGSPKILNDGSLDLDGWSALTHWIGQDFFEQLADNGVVALAWVMPLNLRAHADANRVLAIATRPIVNTFEDLEGAYAWLIKSPATSNGWQQ